MVSNPDDESSTSNVVRFGISIEESDVNVLWLLEAALSLNRSGSIWLESFIGH